VIDLARATREIDAAAARGEYFPEAWRRKLDLAGGYAVQLGRLDRRLAEGKRQAGWKVGLTAPAIQRQFEVHEPVFGWLLEEGRLASPAKLDHAGLIAPGFETEIAMELDADLAGPAVDRDAAARAVARVYPAFEVIETRGAFSGDLPLALADNAQQKAFVLGPAFARWREVDLAQVTVAVGIDGRVVAEGKGSDVLGHPLDSLAWLARALARHGRKIAAGQIVITGSLVRQFPIARGNRISARFDPLGEVAIIAG